MSKIPILSWVSFAGSLFCRTLQPSAQATPSSVGLQRQLLSSPLWKTPDEDAASLGPRPSETNVCDGSPTFQDREHDREGSFSFGGAAEVVSSF